MSANTSWNLLDGIAAETWYSRYFGLPREEVLRWHQQCSICGSILQVRVRTQFAARWTQETVTCPECGIQVRKLLHKLQ